MSNLKKPVFMKKIVAVLSLLFFVAATASAQERRNPRDFLASPPGSFDRQLLRLDRRVGHPFRGDLQDYYGLFRGSASQEYQGEPLLHVRGSRHDELGYQFENIDIRSGFTGLPLFRFIPETLGELSLTSSPSAEQSSANAVVNHRFRSPASGVSVLAQAETDRFTNDFNRRFGTFSYGYQDYVLVGEGNMLHDKLKFVVGLEHERFSDHYRKFWQGFQFGDKDDQPVDNISGETLEEVFGVSQLRVRDGNIPEAASWRYTGNGYVESQLGNLRLRLVSLFNRHEQQQNVSPIKFLFDQARIPRTQQTAGTLSLETEYHFSTKGSAQLHFGYLRSSDKRFDPIFRDSFFLYRDSLATVRRGLNWDAPSGQMFDTAITGPGDFLFNSFRFDKPGDLLTSYSKGEENGFNLATSVSHELNEHRIIIGSQFERKGIRRFSIGSSFGYAQTIRNATNGVGDRTQEQLLALRSNGDVRTFGYDLFGNRIEKSDDINDGVKHPTHIAGYVTDSINSNNLEIKAGLRYDRFLSDENMFWDVTDPQLRGDRNGNILPTALKKVPARQYVSPRLAVQYAAGQRLNLGFTFGQYVQQVRLRDVYASRQTRWQNLVQSFGLIRNTRAVAAGPTRTKQTVVSVDYDFGHSSRFHSAIYIRTSSGLLQMERIRTAAESQVLDYFAYTRNGESVARGLEVGLHFRVRNLTSTFNYSYSDAKGFYPHPASSLTDLFQHRELNSTLDRKSQLNYNFKHSGDLLAQYVFEQKAPRILRHLGVAVRFNFTSGHRHEIFDGRPG